MPAHVLDIRVLPVGRAQAAAGHLAARHHVPIAHGHHLPAHLSHRWPTRLSYCAREQGTHHQRARNWQVQGHGLFHARLLC